MQIRDFKNSTKGYTEMRMRRVKHIMRKPRVGFVRINIGDQRLASYQLVASVSTSMAGQPARAIYSAVSHEMWLIVAND